MSFIFESVLKMHVRSILMIILVLGFPAGLGMYGCSQNSLDDQNPGHSDASGKADQSIAELMKTVGVYHFERQVPAPQFDLKSVRGDTLSLDQFRGKVVLLSFWTTW